MIDAEARERIAGDLDHSFLVEAAAGTGKTTALIGRIVTILARGRARLEEIVALTFTTKAAGEMKLRLRAELERARADADDAEIRARLEAALATLEAARIGTIHSFCHDLLIERPVEAGIDPAAEVIDEDQADALLERAFAPFFEARLEDPPEGIRRVLRRRGNPRAALLRAARQLIEWRDHDTPWAFPEGFERTARIDALMETLISAAALAELARDPRDFLRKPLERVHRFVQEVRTRERLRPRDYDGIEAELRALSRGREWRYVGRGRWYGEGILRSDAVIRKEEAQAQIEAFLRDADTDLAAHLFRDLWPLVGEYERLQMRSGKLDFLELLIRARDLIRDDEAVREELRARFRCVFVDEFQDTDPLQAEILAMLATDGPMPPGGALSADAPPPVPGKLFVVGDPKQSIYGFRRADVSLYERLKRRWTEAGVQHLELTTSFRARPPIQRAINAGFAPLMTGPDDGSQADYVPLAEHRAPNDARPAVIALPIPQPYGHWGKVSPPLIRDSAADVVAAFVRWLIDSDWTLHDPLTGEERGFSSRDVCLLFRSTVSYGENKVQPYALKLEAHGIPHVVVGGRSFADREEILSMATAAHAIERPGDRLSVYATLRGPFFGLTDDALLAHLETVGPLHPLAPLGEALYDPATEPVASALDILRELHVGRARRPIADTLARLLDATRAHAGVAHWPNGEQALANVLRVLDLARRFEANGGTSFRAFAERLEELIARGRGIDAPVVEEREEGVRVMTVHSAKGLEFPVVILCDPTLSREKKSVWRSSWIDPDRQLRATPLADCAPLELREHEDAVRAKEEAEEVRLTYVAATRAREVLVVPCVGDEPFASWLDPLHRALYPSERRESARAPGCPDFGDDTVLDRPPKVGHGAERSVKPGLHRTEHGEVVWWDPTTLPLGRVPAGGIRRHGLLAGDEDDGRAALHDAWVERRDETRAQGAAPSWRVRPVTAVAHETEHTSHAPAIEQTDVDREARPSGKRFGTLVHEILAECPLDADAVSVKAMARHQGRRLDATDDEVTAAAQAALAALAHPRLQAAREATEHRRETPITVPLDDGTSAEGVIDLAYRTDDGWVVVDFKSDRERGEKLTHAVQLEIYARAVGRATGERVQTVVLYV